MRIAKLEGKTASLRHTRRVARGDVERHVGEELVDLIESAYDDYGLDWRDIEIEQTSGSRKFPGTKYHIVSVGGFYGILMENENGDVTVEEYSDDWNDISRSFKRWTK